MMLRRAISGQKRIYTVLKKPCQACMEETIGGQLLRVMQLDVVIMLQDQHLAVLRLLLPLQPQKGIMTE